MARKAHPAFPDARRAWRSGGRRDVRGGGGDLARVFQPKWATSHPVSCTSRSLLSCITRRGRSRPAHRPVQLRLRLCRRIPSPAGRERPGAFAAQLRLGMRAHRSTSLHGGGIRGHPRPRIPRDSRPWASTRRAPARSPSPASMATAASTWDGIAAPGLKSDESRRYSLRPRPRDRAVGRSTAGGGHELNMAQDACCIGFRNGRRNCDRRTGRDRPPTRWSVPGSSTPPSRRFTPGPAPKSILVKIEPWAREVKAVSETVDAESKTVVTEFTRQL